MGGLPGGLADELRDKSAGSPGWFRTFIDNVLIPNGQTVGYLTEIGELVVGLALIGTAAALIFAPDRLGDRSREALFGLTAVSALLALVMNVNFHLAYGSPHPWLVPTGGVRRGRGPGQPDAIHRSRDHRRQPPRRAASAPGPRPTRFSNRCVSGVYRRLGPTPRSLRRSS